MIDTKELYWAAGFLDGEGCFTNGKLPYPVIRAGQNERQLLDKLQSVFHLGSVKKYGKRMWHEWIVSSSNSIGIMMTLYPLLSTRRQNQIKQTILKWKQISIHNKYKSRCKNGHLFDNVTSAGARECLTCQRQYQ